jgi:hypothetical protein
MVEVTLNDTTTSKLRRRCLRRRDGEASGARADREERRPQSTASSSRSRARDVDMVVVGVRRAVGLTCRSILTEAQRSVLAVPLRACRSERARSRCVRK